MILVELVGFNLLMTGAGHGVLGRRQVKFLLFLFGLVLFSVVGGRDRGRRSFSLSYRGDCGLVGGQLGQRTVHEDNLLVGFVEKHNGGIWTLSGSG